MRLTYAQLKADVEVGYMGPGWAIRSNGIYHDKRQPYGNHALATPGLTLPGCAEMCHDTEKNRSACQLP